MPSEKGSVSTTSYLIGNRYQLIKRLGEGGMGKVYEAKDRLSDQLVALKRLKSPSGDQVGNGDTIVRKRMQFVQEFRVLSALHHPHIISVLDFGFETDGRPYFTMPLLRAARTIVEAGRDQDTNYKVRLLVETLEALVYIHRHGVIHCDLKPSNILVDRNQRVKILDFGLAGAAEFAQTVKGTWAYMAPERLTGAGVFEQSDLYSLGVVAYELFTGKMPFTALSVQKLISDVLNAPVDLNLEVIPPSLQAFLGRLLNKEPEARYRSAADALKGLSTAVGGVYSEALAVRENLLQTAKFVGREGEQQSLELALAAAFHNSGSAWLVAGVSGIGKSRLLSALRDKALVTGATVIEWHYAEHQGQPYLMWREVLRRLLLFTPVNDEELSLIKRVLPDVERYVGKSVETGPLRTDQGLYHQFDTEMIELFRRQQQPVVLLLDDLHWSKDSSNLLRELSREAPHLPLLIVGTYRSDESPYLYGKFPEMEHIELKPFSMAETVNLVRSIIGERGSEVVEFLYEQTEGHPFFLVEALRSLALNAGSLERITLVTMPNDVYSDRMSDIVRRRMTGLVRAHRRLLRIAALIGREIDFELLQAIGGDLDYEDWLAACMDAAILKLERGKWLFAHDKIREGVVRSLPETAKRRMHRMVAEAIEGVYPDQTSYTLALVWHWREADVPTKEIHYVLQYAPQAVRTGAYLEARPELELSLERAASHALFEEQMQLQYYLAEIDEKNGNYTLALENYRRSLQIAEQLHVTEYQAKALLGIGRLQVHQGQHREAEAFLNTVLEVCKQSAMPLERAQAMLELGGLFLSQLNASAAQRMYSEVKLTAEHLGNLFLLAQAYGGLSSVAIVQKLYADAKNLALVQLELSRRLSDQTGVIQSKNSLCLFELNTGNPDKARVLGEEALEAAHRIGDQRWITILLGNLAFIFAEQDNYLESKAWYERSIEAARKLNTKRLLAGNLGALGQVQILLQDWSGARHSLREWLTIANGIESVGTLLHGFYGCVELAIHDSNFPLGAQWLGVIEENAAKTHRDEVEHSLLRTVIESRLGGDADHWISLGRRTPLQDVVDYMLRNAATIFAASD